MTTTYDLNTCAGCKGEEEDEISVVVCRHVVTGDEPEDGEITITIHGYTGDSAPPNHHCGEGNCPEVGLCSFCWSNLPSYPVEHYFPEPAQS